MSRSKRNGTIEILRFVFCICVLMVHVQNYVFEEPSFKDGIHLAIFPHGSMGVEFFFIVTGWLMAKSICSRKNSGNEKSLSSETISFVKKKYLGILPYSIIATMFEFIVNCFVKDWGITEIIKRFVEAIPNFFLIQMSGLTLYNINSPTWYLSVMMISCCILFPLAYKYYDNFVKLVLPVAGLIILGIVYVNFGESLSGVRKWTGVAYKGALRGFVEIGFGMVSYEVSKYLQKLKITKKLKYSLRFVEIFCYASTFTYIMFTFKKSYEILVLGAIWLGVTITFSGVTKVEALDNSFSEFLGKASLPIYLCHFTAIILINYFSDYFNSYTKVIMVVAVAFTLAIFCKLLGNKFSKLLNKKINSLSLRKSI